VAVANVDEFRHTGRDIEGLYTGVWGGEVHPDNSSAAVGVLKKLGYGHLFVKSTLTNPADKSYASYHSLAELMRESLRDCIVVLRHSKERFVVYWNNINKMVFPYYIICIICVLAYPYITRFIINIALDYSN
jgi:hypothetical protein